MASFDVHEQRTIIKLCVSLKKSPNETIEMIKKETGKDAVNVSTVYKWHGRFSRGERSSADDFRAGRPTSINSGNVTSVKDLLETARRATVRYVSERIGISKSSAHRILTDTLGMRKVAARWVPRLLTKDEMKERVSVSEEFLRQYSRDGERFLNRIITTDETQVNLYDPETKQESMVWKRTSSPPPIKARVNKSAKKVMFMMFMDSQGMLLVHAVPEGRTVTGDYYSKVIRRDLVRAIQKKRPGADLDDYILHQDNAPPHRKTTTVIDIEFAGFEILRHAPYSPDTAPMDFAVFPALKSELRGIRHPSRTDLIKNVQKTVRKFDKAWYPKVYEKWVMRHRKVIQHNGVYFEKL